MSDDDLNVRIDPQLVRTIPEGYSLVVARMPDPVPTGHPAVGRRIYKIRTRVVSVEPDSICKVAFSVSSSEQVAITVHHGSIELALTARAMRLSVDLAIAAKGSVIVTGAIAAMPQSFDFQRVTAHKVFSNGESYVWEVMTARRYLS